jgi:DNA topoisomerase-3
MWRKRGDWFMKTLLVAEKKSAAEDFAKGLETYGKFKTVGRSFESDKYVITWLQGHVISMKETRDYPNWGGKWDLAALPWYPPNMQFEYKVTDYTKKVFEQVTPIMKRKDIDLIISATDAGREGDLIFWEVYDFLKLNTPVKRFFESAVLTPANIQRIMANDLKGPSFYKTRKDAAYGRAYADLLLGMNFTIGFTAKAGTLLNLGRVKTPTLAILAKRREEINNFKEEIYFELEAKFGDIYTGTWFKDQLGNTKLEKTEDVEAIIAKISGKTGKITKKEVKEHKERHPLLYSLTSLQRDASKKFNLDPNETLEIAQSLYDVHKVLSYPRSDSEVIGTAHVEQLGPILNAINIERANTYILADSVILMNDIIANFKLCIAFNTLSIINIFA